MVATAESAATNAADAGLALPESAGDARAALPTKVARGLLETRMETVLAALVEPNQVPSPTLRQGHLALLKRWYYRPEVRRTGEIFFPGPEGQWPVKAILRGVGRVAAKMVATGGSQ